MKKKLSVLLVLVLAVAISAYSVGGTYAKYTTTANYTGTANVAKWNIAMKSGDTTLTAGESFSIARTADTNVADERIAPGTTGTFNLQLDATNTEVAFGYTISFTVTNKPTNLKFYSDSSYQNEITATSDVYTVSSNTIGLADAKTTNDTIYWKWEFETTDGDATDTAEGIADQDMTVNVTLTATQVD